MKTTGQVHYTCSALKDGTILVAVPKRKPLKKGLYKGERIDEDGISRWSVETTRDYRNMREWPRGDPYEVIANCLNMKRVVRRQVEPRLDDMQGQELIEICALSPEMLSGADATPPPPGYERATGSGDTTLDC